MKRFARRLATREVVVAVVTLLSTGVADARIALNHNETVLPDGP